MRRSQLALLILLGAVLGAACSDDDTPAGTVPGGIELDVQAPAPVTATADVSPIATTGRSDPSIPSVTLRVRPDSYGSDVIPVERHAAKEGETEDVWRVNLDVDVTNNGSQPITADTVTIGYNAEFQPGSVISLQDVLRKNQDLILEPGERTTFVVRDHLRIFPVPPTATLSFTFLELQQTVETTVALNEHISDVPQGAYRFPARQQDLEEGQYFTTDGFHAWTRTQIFAYDLVVREWDGDSWEQNRPGTTGFENNDYYGFGLPLFAMADGTVIGCRRSQPENTPTNFDNPDGFIASEAGGNVLWVQHATGEYVEYAHMMQNSVPLDVCPVEALGATLLAEPVPIYAGQHIGNMGNTGSSSGPHLHIHVQTDPPSPYPYDGNSEALPFRFYNFDVIDRSLADGSDPATWDWNRVTSDQPATIPTWAVFSPNPCGYYETHENEVVVTGVPSACWQSVFDDVAGRGHELDYVDVYETGAGPYYNAIFRPADGAAWIANTRVRSEDFQDLFLERTAAGYRLEHIESYTVSGELRFAVVFDKSPGPAWVSYAGATESEHIDLFNQYRRDGFFPVNVAVSSVGGQRLYTALYEQREVGRWVQLAGIPEVDFQARFDELGTQGFKLMYINAYTHGGERFFSATWQLDGPGTAAAHGMTDFDSTYEAQRAAGRNTIAITGYVSDTHRFAGVWC